MGSRLTAIASGYAAGAIACSLTRAQLAQGCLPLSPPQQAIKKQAKHNFLTCLIIMGSRFTAIALGYAAGAIACSLTQAQLAQDCLPLSPPKKSDALFWTSIFGGTESGKNAHHNIQDKSPRNLLPSRFSAVRLSFIRKTIGCKQGLMPCRWLAPCKRLSLRIYRSALTAVLLAFYLLAY